MDDNHEFYIDGRLLRCTGCPAWIDARRHAVHNQRLTMCRLEADDLVLGWHCVNPGVRLLHPDRYPARLAANGKAGRAVELGPDLQPTGKVWGPLCGWCGATHAPPLDGSCLI